MTVVIAHGQPKSGSTFLYMAAIAIAEHINGEEFYKFMYRTLGSDFQSFQSDVSLELLNEIDRSVGSGRMFVVKTHGALTDDVSDLISIGRVKAFTSFRDPRDTALSTLNVGERDRKEGVERWFAQITEMHQLVGPIRKQTRDTFRWARHPSILAIPYYMTTLSQATSVGLLATHLGAGAIKSTLSAEMNSRRESLPEFNKAVLDRFVEEFTVEDLKLCGEVWAELIAEYEELLDVTMSRFGYRMAYLYHTDLRNSRIRQRLAPRLTARSKAD